MLRAVCGRAKLTTTPEILRDLFELLEIPELPPRFNIAPTQPLAVIRAPGVLEQLRFGLVPPWAKDIAEGNRFINARAETVAKLPAYREGFRSRRCLVVVDGFYEWTCEGEHKQPHLIRLQSGQPFALGGVWGSWTSRDGEVVESVSIITAAAEGPVGPLHNRMPLVLAPEIYREWLDPNLEDPAGLLKPARVAEIVTEPVSRAVNSPRNDGLECIAPPELPEQPSLFG